eukprot:CAMPEP_0183376090 /NCGR_PEP_ID=MMETSP0164_2-20130417/119232_1 /TAXON_ID=221442 /ORGANISM="Coccolithus pelagicus ssp braarudi, Strain PLY182g" /LENGTH=66 /DNA_ID=CAMNT_0025553335 /DNA_START=85 /DNA_END=285 /DNA_ORIENTATION=-
MKDHSQVVVPEGNELNTKRLPLLSVLLKCMHIYVDEAPVQRGRLLAGTPPVRSAHEDRSADSVQVI